MISQQAWAAPRAAPRARTVPLVWSWSALVATAWLLPVLTAGCQPPAPGHETPPASEQSVRRVTVVKPVRKTIRRAVGQPGFIQAFEHTPIVAKIPGYVLKWHVDIGDRIRKDQVLAELRVPEMVSELKLKEALVQQARKAHAMAQAQVVTAQAQVREATDAVGQADATYRYWQGQKEQFAKLVKENVLDQQTQQDTQRQYRAAAAARSVAQSRVESAKAMAQEKERARDKAEVDIQAAEAARRQQQDLVDYATLKAPYDGVVTQRNNNLSIGQFVQPATGAQADVLYVVERTDPVRVFVSVPETDASWVQVGTPVTVRVQALQGQEFEGKVTRTAWSLNKVTRTLLTEIDLPNPDLPNVGRRLRPGMYAYATVSAQWPDVLTLPGSAIVTEGDVNVGFKSYCYRVEHGHVKRTQIEVGARNDQLVEVLKKHVTTGAEPHWEPFNGSEEVVRGGLSGLQDGQAVEVTPGLRVNR